MQVFMAVPNDGDFVFRYANPNLKLGETAGTDCAGTDNGAYEPADCGTCLRRVKECRRNLLSKTQAFLTIGSSIVSFGDRKRLRTVRTSLRIAGPV